MPSSYSVPRHSRCHPTPDPPRMYASAEHASRRPNASVGRFAARIPVATSGHDVRAMSSSRCASSRVHENVTAMGSGVISLHRRAGLRRAAKTCRASARSGRSRSSARSHAAALQRVCNITRRTRLMRSQGCQRRASVSLISPRRASSLGACTRQPGIKSMIRMIATVEPTFSKSSPMPFLQVQTSPFLATNSMPSVCLTRSSPSGT